MVATDVVRATPDRLDALAFLMGRAFVTEPIMQWMLGVDDDFEARCIKDFTSFMEDLIPLGAVWEAGFGLGAVVWFAPEVSGQLLDAYQGNATNALPDGGAERYDAFWAWVESKVPPERISILDSIGVAPEAQGRGIGSTLMHFVLEQARGSDVPVFLETGTPSNVGIYEHFGFGVVDDADAPDGGPHVWFMRWNPP